MLKNLVKMNKMKNNGDSLSYAASKCGYTVLKARAGVGNLSEVSAI